MPKPEPASAARVILLRAEAPPKPPTGAPCNGCGACCAAEPCPLGIVLSGRTRGPCAALAWDDAGARHVCGALADPGRHLRWLPPRWRRALVARWIAAGHGCDADFEIG